MSDDGGADFSHESHYEQHDDGFHFNFGDAHENPYSNRCEGCHGTKFIKVNGTLVCS